MCEGVFAKFPGLKVVLMESGVTWLPGVMNMELRQSDVSQKTKLNFMKQQYLDLFPIDMRS